MSKQNYSNIIDRVVFKLHHAVQSPWAWLALGVLIGCFCNKAAK